jgi:hypothetical protein
MISKILEHWKRLSLAKQFAVAALGVLLPGAVATAWWIPDKINEAVIKNTAAVTVLYMDGLLAPLLSELETTGNLSPNSRDKLGKLVQQSKSSGKIISIKIWNLDGTIIYSTFDDMIGQKFELSAEMEQAKQGFLAADFKNIGEEENKHERAVGVPLLEVYAPVRDPKTRDIIAISEFYADGSDLDADINYATRMSWLLVGGAASLLLGALSLIVSRGSQTIARSWSRKSMNCRTCWPKTKNSASTFVNQMKMSPTSTSDSCNALEPNCMTVRHRSWPTRCCAHQVFEDCWKQQISTRPPSMTSVRFCNRQSGKFASCQRG